MLHYFKAPYKVQETASHASSSQSVYGFFFGKAEWSVIGTIQMSPKVAEECRNQNF